MSRDLRQPRVHPPPAPNIGTLLLEAYRAFERELFAAFRAHGHDALRPKHGAVLANVPKEGTRLTDLSAIAGMAKPSMKELVDELLELGYVARLEDAEDKRVRRIVLTRRGMEVALLARKAIERIEQRYAAILGERGYASLRSALSRLIDAEP